METRELDNYRGAWVVPSVECPTLGFDLGRDLGFLGWSAAPCLGFLLRLPLPLLLAQVLSLSQIQNKNKSLKKMER